MGCNLDKLTDFKDNCGFGLIAHLKNKATHQNLKDAIESLSNMMHRGAVAADGISGDGSGLLLSLPNDFMRNEAKKHNVELPVNYAVAMIFYTDNEIEKFEKICTENDLEVVLKREVPIDISVLGKQALDILPKMVQVFVVPKSIVDEKRFNALVYLSRKECEHAFTDNPEFYIASFSSKVISYKGLVMPTTIKHFYKDLSDENFKISFALYHQRFSTNTLPRWKLAQPLRTIAHNGEINSIKANRFNLAIKQESIKSDIFTQEELNRLFPILQDSLSDSASLDNMFEFLIVNGVDFFKAARSIIPAPWQNSPYMDADLRAFYEYCSVSHEAWDGPAAVSLTDGRFIGCVIDRNGLRPSKYVITNDDRMFITSEYGTVSIPDGEVKVKGRLKSGQMIGLDLKNGSVFYEDDINSYLKSSNKYSQWLNSNVQYLQEYTTETFLDTKDYFFRDLVKRQKNANITYEIIDEMINPMSDEGKEPTGSMGDDSPLACFSNASRSFNDFFRQKFAQVTNPPIDPYREKIVMSLNTGFGCIYNILKEDESFTKRLKSNSPILMKEKFDVLKDFGDKSNEKFDVYYSNKTFSTTFTTDIKKSLEKLYADIKYSIENENTSVVILDDRDVSAKLKILPITMVLGFVNTNLLKDGLKSKISIVSVTSEVFDPHSAAVLLAYGTTAIYPYIMYATILANCDRKNLHISEVQVKLKNSQRALNGGLMKIMSKMGIATIASYRNSSLFDILGLSDEIIADCFENSDSDLNGLGYDDIEKNIERLHFDSYQDRQSMFPLKFGGIYKHLVDGEFHDYGPETTKSLHNSFDDLRDLVNNRDKKFIRDFFEFNSDKKSIDIENVESKEDIFKRFSSAAMSCGSISIEAHETIATAMNTIGAKSNSGEGGEDSARFNTNKNSKIKQIASGRFGVTPGYLVSADELQIKVAQGAKPGEGGQLPGSKVTKMIASLRHVTPGVTLISPPPHHDIYSIEDLSQLIFDLKQVNPKAQVAVKLVSTLGVGTIASGVAKAYADKIIISGADGGTGAAPLTSIKHTGNPWEVGLSEAHNSLKANHLREFVTLETDGGLKTGLDVVKAAMLGAESYAFGTSVLVLLGCKILRICHTNKCSVGVATQDDDLREHFNGSVDRVIKYFEFMANDIRKILAELGFKSLEEIIGRSDLLKVIDDEMANKFNFDNILRHIDGVDTCQKEFNHPFDKNEMENELLEEIKPFIKKLDGNLIVKRDISNLNRSFGALISGEIARHYGDAGLGKNNLRIDLKGIAGQSFGAFLSKGVELHLNGVSNDYVGKGMSGGKIIIKPELQGEEFSGAGNTCLYGSTGGSLFISANVGERFAVRNSGTIAVVEGTGNSACEYMTGGIVVVLGQTGVNFGAGMTGGIAFVYDKQRNFMDNMNQELIEALRIDTDDSERERLYLKNLLTRHVKETDSLKAKNILDNFREEIRNFWMAKPKNMKSLPLNPNYGD